MAQNFEAPIRERLLVGYSDTGPPENLGPGYFQVVDNAHVSDNKIEKISGSSQIASPIAAFTINGLTSFEVLSTGSKSIIALIDGASNAQLYKWTGSGTFSAIGTANLTNGSPMNFEVAANSLWGFDGVEVIDYDDTTVTKNRSGVPMGYFPAWFHNYLFVARTDTFPNRLFWSNLGDPTIFDPANFIDINPGDSDQIMGLGKIQDELLVFKKNNVWGVTGFSGSTFSSTTASSQNTNARLLGYGCAAPRSIVSTGNDIYFLSFLGESPIIRNLKKTSFSTTLGGGIVSSDIAGTMATINLNAIEGSTASFDGRYVRFCVPVNASAVNNLTLVLDTWNIKSGKYPWSTESTKPAGYYTLSTISGKQVLYFSSSAATGKVLKYDPSLYTDDGVDITMDVQSRSYWLDPARKSKWKYIYVTYETGSDAMLDVNTRLDRAVDFITQETLSLQGSSPPLGDFILGESALGGANLTTNRVPLAQQTGHTMQVQFYESSDNPVVVNYYEIYGKLKGLRAD